MSKKWFELFRDLFTGLFQRFFRMYTKGVFKCEPIRSHSVIYELRLPAFDGFMGKELECQNLDIFEYQFIVVYRNQFSVR